MIAGSQFVSSLRRSRVIWAGYQLEQFFGGGAGLAYSASAWPVANMAQLWPFYIERACVAKFSRWHNGGTVAGNIDVGIYDYTFNRLVSTGSTAQAGTSTTQTVNITDTPLRPGMYWLAIVMSSGSAELVRTTINDSAARALGMFTKTTSFPLPSTFTGLTSGGSYIPSAAILTTPI